MGGPDAFEEVESVLPGMLVPVLIDNDGPVGQRYSAQFYKGNMALAVRAIIMLKYSWRVQYHQITGGYSMKVLFFDLFHTLVVPRWNEDEGEHKLLGITREQWSEASTREDLYYDRAVGKVSRPRDIIKAILDNLNMKVSEEKLEELVQIRLNKFKKTLATVDKDIMDTLVELKNRGYKICLISNADKIDIVHWELCPVSELFDEVIFSCNVNMAKPEASIYELGMKLMKVDSSQSIFIGDGGSDELRGAKKMGMKTVLTSQYFYLGDRIKEERARIADHHVSNLKELCSLEAL